MDNNILSNSATITKKTAIYCRVAHFSVTDMKSQINNVVTFAKENNMNDLVHYYDNGFSGLNFERPEFHKLQEDIDKNLIDTVVIRDISRIGRDYLLTGKWYDKMLIRGIKIVTVEKW